MAPRAIWRSMPATATTCSRRRRTRPTLRSTLKVFVSPLTSMIGSVTSAPRAPVVADSQGPDGPCHEDRRQGDGGGGPGDAAGEPERLVAPDQPGGRQVGHEGQRHQEGEDAAQPRPED